MKKWLEQHSPNGEMWYSLVFSISSHMLVIAFLMFAVSRAFSRQQDYSYSVATDVIYIEKERFETEEKPQEEIVFTPKDEADYEREKFEPIVEPTIGPEFKPTPETKPYEEPEKKAQALPAQKNVSSKNTAKASGSKSRGARWTLLIDKSDIGRYIYNLEKLGCTIAFPVGKDEIRYFSKPTNKPGPSYTDKKSEDRRLRWKQKSSKTAERVSEWMNLPKFQKMYWFMSESLESRLVELELKKAREVRSNATEDDLMHTHFKMTETNGQIKIECESVTFKE